MCGIALVVDRTGAGVDPDQLAGMTAALAARGPDDEAFLLGDWAAGTADCFGGAATDPAAPLPSLAGAQRPGRWSIGLGVRRLGIRDPDPRARQPMPGRRGLWLAFNGEVYNADAIRDELRGAGRVFRSAGDTEVFLAAWETWGPDALARLSGMWAFAVWDAPRRRVWCGRDPLGIKPLYLAPTPSGVLVASSPRAIVAGLGARPSPHAATVAEYLATGLLDHGAPTCFSGIARIGAGCLIEIGDAGVVERRWAPSLAATPSDDGDRVTRFHDALDRAVASHRASDRPAGALLSGGLDSATIVLSAAAEAPPRAPLTLFTAGFENEACDERAVAAVIAARTPFAWQVTDVGAPSGLGDPSLADDVSSFLTGLDEPVVSSSAYAQWCVMRRVAAAGVRVVLDGQGADELLCGYPALVGPALADDVRGGDLARAWAALDARAGKGEGSRAGLAARGAVALLPEPLAIAAGRLAGAGTAGLHPELAATWHAAAPSMPAGAGATAPHTRLAAARARLLAVHLPALLRYLDTSSMAWSIEARVPFLDREVVAAGLALDGADLWRDGWQKWVLRDPRCSRLPDAVRLAPRKRAFAAPEAAWWRGPLRAWLRDVLAPGTIARQGVLAPAVVAGALDTLDRGGAVAPELWRWANVTWWVGAMRRVGLVAYWYPPQQAAGALRAAALARYLPAFGWEPVVVTVRPRSSLHLPPGPPGRDDVPPPALATTDRAWHALAAAAVEALRGSDALEGLKTENVLAGRRPHARAAHWVYRQWLSFPDDAWPWLVDRGSVTRVFAAHGVDAIVSTSPPPTAHLVAAAAARRLRVPWVADYRDPWSQRSAWRRAWPLAGVEARLERHTLSQAAHVVTVSAPIADNLRRLLGRPVAVVPNGFDPVDRDVAAIDPLPIAGDRFTLVHTGTLTNQSRDPGLLFAALHALVARGDLPIGALEVWFVGRHPDVARRTAAHWPALAPAIHYAGAVPRATALDAQRRATVLVALGSPDAAYDGDMPTKVFEYLDARRPILAIASHQGALAALLDATRGGRVASTSAEAEAALVHWLGCWRRDGRVTASSDPQAIARYERRRLTGEFAQILDRVTGGLLDEAV